MADDSVSFRHDFGLVSWVLCTLTKHVVENEYAHYKAEESKLTYRKDDNAKCLIKQRDLPLQNEVGTANECFWRVTSRPLFPDITQANQSFHHGIDASLFL